jgi:hypothetical protein
MIRKQNQAVDSLEVWERLAGPKSRDQWKDHRSAKESAKAWLGGDGAGEIPKEIRTLFSDHPAFSQVTEWEAEPEGLVSFDGFRGPANIDVLARMKDELGRFVMAVEAKADESFGPLVGRVLAAALERRLASPRSQGIVRVEQLASSILGPAEGRVPRMHQIRYQLLTATAAALARAHELDADRAVLMIHEFRTPKTDARRLRRNRDDLGRFLTRLGSTSPEEVFERRLVGPFKVPGGERFPDPADLYVGKAVREVSSGEKTL